MGNVPNRPWDKLDTLRGRALRVSALRPGKQGPEAGLSVRTCWPCNRTREQPERRETLWVCWGCYRTWLSNTELAEAAPSISLSRASPRW